MIGRITKTNLKASVFIAAFFTLFFVLPSSASAELIFPPTPCDAIVDALPKVRPNSVKEDGTIAFMYGPDNNSFVSVEGDVFTFNVKIFFDPGAIPTIKLNTLNIGCTPLSGNAFNDIIPFGENILTYDHSTGVARLNSQFALAQQNGVPSYLWIEVLDEFFAPEFVSYSYVIDIQNPQNPTGSTDPEPPGRRPVLIVPGDKRH